MRKGLYANELFIYCCTAGFYILGYTLGTKFNVGFIEKIDMV